MGIDELMMELKEMNKYITMNKTIANQTEESFDYATFSEDLAKELGGEVIEYEKGSWGNCKIKVGEVDIRVWRASKNKGTWKIEVSVYANLVGKSKIDYRRQPDFPHIKVNPTRDIKVLARDIRKRAIDKAKEPLEELRKLIAAHEEQEAGITTVVHDLEQQFPMLSLTPSNDGTTASLRIYSNEVYLVGDVFPDGKISIQRIGNLSAEKANKLLHALLDD